MEDLDPEEARAIIDPALKLMIDATHSYDGYVVQSTGDGIFALFGDFVSRSATIGSFCTKSVFVYCPITDPGSVKAPGGTESRDHRVIVVEF
jgi:class 3 adenylate cyclase